MPRQSQAPARPIAPVALHTTFRSAAVLLAVVVGVYSIWLLLAELARPALSLPTDSQSAALAAKQRREAHWAAAEGGVRGDLWAVSAFTFADLLWSNTNDNSQLEQARGSLARAVRYAPSDASVWLLLGGLALRYHWSKPDPAEALRMSYYTGPNESSLMALRSLVAAQLPTLDADLQRLAQHDVRVLFKDQQQSALIQAYHSATPAGKRVIEQELSASDPRFIEALRRGAE
jgi:hypothetical protein